MDKMGRAVSRSVRGSKPSKYNVKLFVEEIRNLPESAFEAQLIWNRGQRVAMTNTIKVKNGVAIFNESIQHTTTLYKKADASFEQKNYNFRVKVGRQNQDGSTPSNVICKKIVNISDYVSDTKEEKKLKLDMDAENGQTGGKGVTVSGTIYSEFSADQTLDTESAISGLSGLGAAGLPPPVAPPAPVEQKSAVVPAKIPEEEVAPVPAVPDQSVILNQVKGDLANNVGAVLATEAYKKKTESLNLEATGRKIGEGVADSAFGDKRASDDEEGDLTIDATLSNQIVEEYVKQDGVKPLASQLMNGMMPPIERRIESNLQMNMCQAMCKLMFPWSSCSK